MATRYILSRSVSIQTNPLPQSSHSGSLMELAWSRLRARGLIPEGADHENYRDAGLNTGWGSARARLKGHEQNSYVAFLP